MNTGSDPGETRDQDAFTEAQVGRYYEGWRNSDAPSLHGLSAYVEALVPRRPPELRAMEEEARRTGFPIIGPACGQFCYLIARLIGTRRIFEMGSGFGYSTAWFGRAVKENGGEVVHHVVWDQELSNRARSHLDALGCGDVVEYQLAEAVAALSEQDGGFDLIFNDIDKHAYPQSLPVIHEKLRPGGVLIIDNMLWHGQIFDPADQSPDAQGVRQFTRRITTDPSWIVSLVPIRDGLIIAYKR